MRLVATFAVSFFVGTVTVRAGCRLVAFLAKGSQFSVQQVLFVRCVRVMAGRALAADRWRMRDSHIQLSLHVFVANET